MNEGLVLHRFFHKWRWKNQDGQIPPLGVRDLIKSQVYARTGRLFLYANTNVRTDRTSSSAYQRGGEVSIQVDPITLTLIAVGVASVLGVLYRAFKGDDLTVGIDIAGLKWYASTDNHQVEGDQGGRVDVPNTPPDNVETVKSSSVNWYVLAAFVGVILLFAVLTK